MVSHGTLNGVATSTKTLIDLQLAAGHEIMLVHKKDGWLGQQEFAGPIERLATGFETRPFEIMRVGFRILDWRRDVVHAHGSRANKYMMAYKILGDVPSVATAHTRQYQIPWAFAHEIMAPSEPTAAFYRRLLPWRKQHVSVVPIPFDAGPGERVTAEQRRLIRSELGLRDETFVMASVGTVGHRKNQIAMLDVLGSLLARGIDAALVLIGQMLLPKEEAGKFAHPRWSGRLHLLGERRDAVRLLPAMDVYLSTSRMEESSVATSEAMAARLPILTTNVGSAGVLVKTGVNGALFGLDDVAGMAAAAERYARQPQERAAAGDAAREAVIRELSPAGILPRIDAVYRAAVERARDRYRPHMGEARPAKYGAS